MGINIPQLQSMIAGLPGDIGRQVGAAFRAQDKANSDLARMFNAPVANSFTPPLQNAWVPVSIERTPVVTQLQSGLVVVQGSVTGGTPGGSDAANIFTLPAGARAVFDFQTFATWTNNAGTATLGRIQLFKDGRVRAREGGSTEFETNFVLWPAA